jgi:hypothetical protein
LNDNIKEHIRDKLNLASQSSSALSQLSVGVAIGLFGILAIYIGIDQVTEDQIHTGFILWPDMGAWELASKITLGIAYFGLIALGASCIIGNKFHGLLQEKYTNEYFKDYTEDQKVIAKSNWLLKQFILVWIESTSSINKSFSFIFVVLIPHLLISILLWFVIAVINKRLGV